MPGFWKRPMTRTYSYNLDVGEHYYNPMTSYLEAERGTRGETPGALTYSERLARRWLTGRRYGATDVSDRYVRSSSVARGEAMAAAASSEVMMSRDSRARSVAASRAATDAYNVSAWSNRRELLSRAAQAKGSSAARAEEAVTANEQLRKQSYVSQRAMQQANQSAATCMKQQQMKRTQASSSSSAVAASSSSSSTTTTKQVAQQQRSSMQQQASSAASSSSRRIESSSRVQDDICKRVADVHMQPWAAGAELDEANSASARAKARILDLERELDEITRRALSAQTHACKTAALMAKEAQMEDEQAMASSYKKTKKVMVESSSRVG